MKEAMHTKQLSPVYKEAFVFPTNTLEWISQNNLWRLWVPKAYNGLELSLTEGLQKLQTLAKTDGSLGWTITLCSGATYFIGNLQPEVADAIFLSGNNQICFGGSGGVFGVAEKQGDNYIISGEWRYATGAPYLTHFTLNAKIMDNGNMVLKDDGTPLVYSFVIPKNDVSIIYDWQAMGLKATATHSFKLHEVVVPKTHAFVYNTFYLPQPIFKIPFTVFADVTLFANYLGMATHFYDEASNIVSTEHTLQLQNVLQQANQLLYTIANTIDAYTNNQTPITEAYTNTIHTTTSNLVTQLTNAIITLYPKLGIKACSEPHILNRIFRDYFTATQHHNFVGR
ncbi:acyl-CoA dehydrogenase [Mariniflexile jejuense]|uniref:Acyl-CoA dehydrogenase n=1 Tax=Mariniflexile jejuense TaxID=1173582 RepID=A0ABW3JLX3_9FLAO